VSDDFTIGQYVLPVPSEQLVATDNSTITGNGSGAAPLAAIGGEIPIIVDGVTITGNGTNESPIATIPDHTPVRSDGITMIGDGVTVALSAPGTGTSVTVDEVTIVGAGTMPSPFRVAPAALAGDVAVDTNASLTGDGLASSPLSVASAPAGSTAVAVDSTSVAGTGRTASALHTVADGTASAVDGTTVGGTGVTGTPLHVIGAGLAGLIAVDTDGITMTGTGLSGAKIAQLPPYVDLRKAPYGVVANDNTKGVTNTAAINQAILDFTGTYAQLVLPEGAIYIDRSVGVSKKWCIDFPTTASQLTLRGHGMFATTLVRFGPGDLGSSQDLRIECSEIEICDFGILQEQITSPDPGQQNHMITLTNGASEIDGHDLYFGKSIGDQLRFVGGVGGPGNGTITNARFDNLVLEGQGVVTSTPPNGRTGSRSGFSFQTGFNGIEIGNFYVTGVENSAIDFEPTGTGINQYVNIHDGVVDNSLSATATPVSLAGNVGNITSYISMSRVDVINGSVGIRNVNHCELDDVRVIINGALPGDPTVVNLLIRNECDSLVLRDLYVLRTGGTAALLVDVQVTGGPVVIEGGQFLQGTTAPPISIIDSPSVHIDGPVITYTGGAPTALDAITVQASTKAVNDCTVDNVRVTTSVGKFHATVSLYQRAGHILRPARVSNIQSAGFSSCGVYMSVQTIANFDATPFISGIQNGADADWIQVDQGNNPIVTIFPCIAGNPGDVASFVSQVTPLGNLPALQGCQCTFKNGDTTALFFKQTATDATGWVQVTVP